MNNSIKSVFMINNSCYYNFLFYFEGLNNRHC